MRISTASNSATATVSGPEVAYQASWLCVSTPVSVMGSARACTRPPRCQLRSTGCVAHNVWPRRLASRIIAKVESL